MEEITIKYRIKHYMYFESDLKIQRGCHMSLISELSKLINAWGMDSLMKDYRKLNYIN